MNNDNFNYNNDQFNYNNNDSNYSSNNFNYNSNDSNYNSNDSNYNSNNFNYDNDEPEFVSQQLPPRGFRPPNQPPFSDNFDQDIPMMGGQPLSAPPNFTPELPREMREQTFGGPEEFGAQFRGGRPSPHRFSRRCLFRFTFIWLINGNSFWFFPIDIGRQHVEGFRWRNGRWVYDRINLNRILFSTCY